MPSTLTKVAHGALLALMLSATALRCAGAQPVPSTSTLSPECQQAIRLAIQGHFQPAEDLEWSRGRNANRNKLDWMWSILPHCGSTGGTAAALAWTATRRMTDTSRLAKNYSGVWSFRDASVFNAALSLVGNTTATPQSRVYSAMLAAAQLFDHAYPTYDAFVETTTYDVCRTGNAPGKRIVTGAPLPPDARTRARATAQKILADNSAPQSVQSAARCLDQTIEIHSRAESP